ncbi:MAG: AAA family ATPase [Nostoc sp.]|uniref:AAA family ATPase n=1 Tax=Nostoc sp. TaxID=1180 RepID=UPI002FF60F66
MFIHKIQIFNYKSYIDSNIIEFSPNINIIVGQNNSGKTALLECLTLKLPSKPHLSIKTLPSPFTKINEESHAKVYLLLTKEELIIFLEQIPLPLGIAVPDDEAYSGEPTEALIVFKRFQDWLEDKAHSHVELCLSLSSNPQYELEKGKITKNLNFNLYSSSENQDHTYNFIEILLDDNRKVNVANIKFCYDEYYRNYTDEVVDYGSFKADYKSTIAYKVFNLFRERIYRFYAERLNISNCSYGNSSLLKPNASNLGEVLYLLPNKNPENFILLNQHISYIFPHIKNVSVVNTNNSQLEIKIWTKEASQYKREDLTIPLSECGTGVGQVIAFPGLVRYT